MITSTVSSRSPWRAFIATRTPPPKSRIQCSVQSPPESSSVSKICKISVSTPAGTTSVLEVETGEFLRNTLINNKTELYQGLWAKAMNCGGGGNCGTCVVEITEDESELMSPRTPTEEKKLKGKPASWRLACQTIVGDGVTGGACSVRIGPM
ncbi:hypothetical protein CEUSTIGMA_g5820.t1 [Chlamydomonas eustigma]|uniref:2Fe-2S ferredoxin-type domain-containing protein n=1 Tax=Chlamydomonas eustigma TaxID=1157962 RepID=A0A250X5P2_9CHLO|nr:hypothetical protein CEUSTIGMA_g5820.t1 [Chlamydomonas eustigma]|eukprot:GAX78378.1 hypothetical protein CEUSTIGMA_g5820.t1 [Chlamydomonas eustigma]